MTAATGPGATGRTEAWTLAGPLTVIVKWRLPVSQPWFQAAFRWTFESPTDDAGAAVAVTGSRSAAITEDRPGKPCAARRVPALHSRDRTCRTMLAQCRKEGTRGRGSTTSRESSGCARSLSTPGSRPTACAMRSRRRSRRDATRRSCRSTCACSQAGGALATLIKLFLLDLDVPAADAEAALPGLSLERLEGMGVLRRRGDQVSAGIELVPSDDLLIACDAFQKELATSDHVLGVSSPARVLAWLTVRSPVERALDLGTGNGHQALLASRHAGTSRRSTSTRGRCGLPPSTRP